MGIKRVLIDQDRRRRKIDEGLLKKLFLKARIILERP